jgi:hypothetical protein
MAISQGSKPAAWNAAVISRSEFEPSSLRIATFGFVHVRRSGVLSLRTPVVLPSVRPPGAPPFAPPLRAQIHQCEGSVPGLGSTRCAGVTAGVKGMW